MKRLIIAAVAATMVFGAATAGFGATIVFGRAAARSPIDGANVYGDKCSGCHGPIAGTTIKDPRPANIIKTMAKESQMTGLKTAVTRPEIAAISKAVVNAKDIAAGTALYNEKCQGCHGDISATTIMNPKPANIVRSTVKVPQMNGLKKTMTGRQLNTLYKAILASDNNTPPPPPPVNNIDGAGLYYKYCLNCHGILRNTTVPKTVTVQQVQNAINNDTGAGTLKGGMGKLAGKLSSDEIAAIAGAVKNGGTPTSDTYNSPDCNSCHNGDGTLKK